MDTVSCPVCTLYLREGVTLQDHLNTHPKVEVIEALVRYSGVYSADGSSKHYHEFVTAYPRAAATLVYPVYPPSSVVRTPNAENEASGAPHSKGACGADCVSCSHYAPYKQDVLEDDNVYETAKRDPSEVSDSRGRIWTPGPESEEPTNLCLRQTGNTTTPDEGISLAPWMPHNQSESGEPCQSRHVGPSAGGTIVEAGEGRTLLNLSELGPMTVLELEGVHFLVPSQFVGNPSSSGTVASPAVATPFVTTPSVAVPSVAAPSVATPSVAAPSVTVPLVAAPSVAVPSMSAPSMAALTVAPPSVAPPPPYPKRSLSPDMDVAESPCSVADSAPPSPIVKRSDSPININIRSDETMPAHGEISEQESVGGNSSSMWPDQNFSSVKEPTCYDSTAKFVPQSFSSTLPPSSPPLQPLDPLEIANDVVEPPQKKPARVPKCRWCQMTFGRQAERRAHICDKRKSKIPTGEPTGEPSTSETAMQVQKPKRVYKRKPKDNPVVFSLDPLPLTDVLVTKLETKKEEGASDPLKNFKCEKCDENFASYRLLASHRGREHKGSRYECSTCSECFEFEAQYNAHLEVHPLECKLCGKIFYRKRNMMLHMRRHLSDKPYKCQFCEKSFVTKQKLNEHSNVHTGNAPIKCPMCDETFKRHSNLVQHKNRHHFHSKRKKKDFICHCGEVCQSKKKLIWHKEIHDEKLKTCSYCSEKFVHCNSLTRHIRKTHDERYVPKVGREVENVQCPICHIVCLKTSLAVHMKIHDGTKPYPCLICGKKFTTKWNLQMHRWIHASRSTKPFKCSLCKSAFYRRSEFAAHMRSHQNVKPYTCDHCGCQFMRKYNCKRHMNEHEKSKSYACTLCDKTFHRNYYLKEHMRVHSKTRPYSCHICGKASSSKSNHNRHVKIHHAREPQNTEG